MVKLVMNHRESLRELVESLLPIGFPEEEITSLYKQLEKKLRVYDKCLPPWNKDISNPICMITDILCDSPDTVLEVHMNIGILKQKYSTDIQSTFLVSVLSFLVSMTISDKKSNESSLSLRSSLPPDRSITPLHIPLLDEVYGNININIKTDINTSDKIIPLHEEYFLNQCILVLQGIENDIFIFESEIGFSIRDSKLHLVLENSFFSQIHKILDCGSIYRILRELINGREKEKVDVNKRSQTLEFYLSALQSILQEYYKFTLKMCNLVKLGVIRSLPHLGLWISRVTLVLDNLFSLTYLCVMGYSVNFDLHKSLITSSLDKTKTKLILPRLTDSSVINNSLFSTIPGAHIISCLHANIENPINFKFFNSCLEPLKNRIILWIFEGVISESNELDFFIHAYENRKQNENRECNDIYEYSQNNNNNNIIVFKQEKEKHLDLLKRINGRTRISSSNDSADTIETFWCRYQITPEFLPSCITPQEALLVLEEGLSSRFVKLFCTENEWVTFYRKYDEGKKEKEKEIIQSDVIIKDKDLIVFDPGSDDKNKISMKYSMDRNTEMSLFINRTVKGNRRKLALLIIDNYKYQREAEFLIDHMFLYREAFAFSVHKKLGASLRKPADTLRVYRLQSLLDEVLIEENQKMEIKLKGRLIAVLQPCNIGDTGWDVFHLSYEYPPPLSVIFRRVSVPYQKISFASWKLFRCDIGLSLGWRDEKRFHRSYNSLLKRENVSGKFQFLYFLCQKTRLDVSAVINEIRSYMMFDVIGKSLNYFKEKVAKLVESTEIGDLNTLMLYHLDLVKELLSGNFLSIPSVSTPFMGFLGVVLDFINVHRETLKVMAAVFKRMNTSPVEHFRKRLDRTLSDSDRESLMSYDGESLPHLDGNREDIEESLYFSVTQCQYELKTSLDNFCNAIKGLTSQTDMLIYRIESCILEDK